MEAQHKALVLLFSTMCSALALNEDCLSVLTLPLMLAVVVIMKMLECYAYLVKIRIFAPLGFNAVADYDECVQV